MMAFDFSTLEDVELLSVNESRSSSSFDLPPVADGNYQVEITEISPQLDNKLKPGQDRRGITFTIVFSEDPEDIGKQFKQYYNVSSHPKAAMYPLFKAAAGGDLDPDKRPRLLDLAHAQMKGTLIHKTGDDGVERQVFEGIMAAKKRYELPPF
jgi:hypothetical protein